MTVDASLVQVTVHTHWHWINWHYRCRIIILDFATQSIGRSIENIENTIQQTPTTSM